MKQRMNWRVWATVVALALGSSIWAGVPASMAVQAIFQDSSGSLLSGSHVIKVGIYDGDVLKWQETFTKIFSKGVFSEVVGIQNPITAENINLTSAKFGFVIDDEPVQLVRLTAVPYALHARFAKTAENIPAATSTFLGGIKVGRGLDMDSNGVLSVSSSNYNAGLSINGTMTATSFEGDGSRLTGIPRYTTGPGLNSNGSLLSIGSNVVTSNYNGTVWINGTVSATSFVGDGSRLTNLNIARELGAVAVINGGTGLTSAPSDGQFLMGSGGGYVKTALTQGAGMMITTGSESISIAHADTSTLNSFTLDGSVLTGLTVDRYGHLTGYKMANFKDGISINGTMNATAFYGNEAWINGTVTATSFVGDGSRLTGIPRYTTGPGLSLNGSTFNLRDAVVTWNYNYGVSINSFVRALLFDGDGSRLTNLNLTGVVTSNYNYGVSINSFVRALYFEGDGSRLTGIPRYTTGPGLSLNGSTFNLRDAVVTWNYNYGVSINSFVRALYFEGDGSRLTNLNLTGVVTSNYNYGVSINSFVRALYFEGDGSRLTGIPRYTTGPGLNSNGSLLSIGSNVVTSNYNGTVWINGTVSATSFEGDGSRLTNLNTGGSAPITVTTTPYQMDDNRRFLIVNNSAGPTTILLPNNPLSSGRVIKIKTIQAQSVISMTPIVVPLNSETPGTAILSGVAGKWAELVSDGTNWVIMSGN